jgi:hypothetical protein
MIRWDLFLVVFGWLPIELCPLIGQVHPPYVDSVEEERLLVLPIAWFVPDWDSGNRSVWKKHPNLFNVNFTWHRSLDQWRIKEIGDTVHFYVDLVQKDVWLDSKVWSRGNELGGTLWGLFRFFLVSLCLLFSVIELEIRAYILSHSTSPFCGRFFQIGSCRTTCPGWLQTTSSWSLPPE